MSNPVQQVCRLGKMNNPDKLRCSADNFALQLTNEILTELGGYNFEQDFDFILGIIAVFSSEHLVGMPILEDPIFAEICRRLNPFECTTIQLKEPKYKRIVAFTGYILILKKLNRSFKDTQDNVQKIDLKTNKISGYSDEEVSNFLTQMNRLVRGHRDLVVGKRCNYILASTLGNLRHPSLSKNVIY